MATNGKPNILFIYSDQHRFDCVAANGHRLVQTPNMDRLGREGARFTQAYTPLPMCVPTRCSLLCGQWPTRHGVVFNFDGETFRRLDPGLPMSSTVVRDAGYHTAHVGRWHVDPQRTPLDFGFNEYIPDWLYDRWRRARGLPPPPHDAGWRGQTDPHITPEESSLAWSADRVIERMAFMQDYDEPFFMRWHVAEPHLPCVPPEPYASLIDPKDIAPWAGFSDGLEGKPFIQKQMRTTWGVEGMSWREWAPIVARYLGVVSLLDNQIGRVLVALDRMGIAENTLVVYTSDHGDMGGSHGMVDKHCVLYDDVVRVPLMMRWPERIPAGRVVEDFVCNAIDCAATFCDAAGVAVPDTFDGVSLLPAACGTGSTGRSDIFAMYCGNQFGGYTQRMVRDRRWKYVWNATDTDELYDLEQDPGELRNRVRDADSRSELKRLRARLLDWMEKTGDPMGNGSTRRQLVGNGKLER